ncbi:MAG: hypothetical protein J6587_07420 [Lactobacillus sp.]|nr:hypothetical protein [Lactobacillus sp.]
MRKPPNWNLCPIPGVNFKNNFEVFIMAKLSKQDKIEIFNLWRIQTGNTLRL